MTGGAGYADTIRFSNLLGLNPTITLFLEPIEMFDDGGDVLDGAYGNMYPTLDASAVNKGLSVNNNTTVKVSALRAHTRLTSTSSALAIPC